MIYGGTKNGEGTIHLSPQENKRFQQGKPIVKESGDSRGRFRIVLKLTRPRRLTDRFRDM